MPTYLSNDRFGFRKGIATRKVIALIERCIDHEQDLYVCFMNYEKALDRVNWSKLLEGLKSIGVDWCDRQLTERLYMGQSARVKVTDGLTNPVVFGRGTKTRMLVISCTFQHICGSHVKRCPKWEAVSLKQCDRQMIKQH